MSTNKTAAATTIGEIVTCEYDGVTIERLSNDTWLVSDIGEKPTGEASEADVNWYFTRSFGAPAPLRAELVHSNFATRCEDAPCCGCCG